MLARLPFLFAFALQLAAVTHLAAQVPTTFTNLQVLPKDISRDSLIEVMRRFALSLGVRCQYCHVGGDGVSTAGIRYADDDDEDKRKAREMLRLVQRLNGELLAALPERDQPPVNVNCFTCHRGANRPRSIELVIGDVITTAGADSAVAHYRDLRNRTYGRGTYDFSEQPLIELARSLTRQHRPAEAERVLLLNLEYHPNVAGNYSGLVEARLARADTAGVISALEKVLELQPQNAEARRRLDLLRRR